MTNKGEGSGQRRPLQAECSHDTCFHCTFQAPSSRRIFAPFVVTAVALNLPPGPSAFCCLTAQSGADCGLKTMCFLFSKRVCLVWKHQDASLCRPASSVFCRKSEGSSPSGWPQFLTTALIVKKRRFVAWKENKKNIPQTALTLLGTNWSLKMSFSWTIHPKTNIQSWIYYLDGQMRWDDAHVL